MARCRKAADTVRREPVADSVSYWRVLVASKHMSGQLPSSDPSDAPVTLHRIMQTMIAEGLKARYEAPKKLSHELFVLMMQ